MTARKNQKKKTNKNNFIYLIAGLLGVLAIGTGTYFFLQQRKASTYEEITPQEEEEIIQKEEELKRQQEEELKRQQEEELKRQQEEELKRQQEEELKRQQEEELKRQQEEELKRQQEEELKRQQEEELKRQQEEELKRQQEEELKRQQEEELKRQQEEELKRQQEEELKRQQEEELKRQQEEELKRQQETSKLPVVPGEPEIAEEIDIPGAYTVVSHNTADIQTNPIENASVLKFLSDRKNNPDTSLRNAAKKLLQIDKSKATYSARQGLDDLKKAFKKVLFAYYKAIGKRKSKKKIAKEVNAFFKKIKKGNKMTLELSKIKFSGFDKMVRQYGATRFSPTFYNRKMISFLSKKPSKMDVAKFTKLWIKEIQSMLKILYQDAKENSKDLKKWREDLLYTFLFDLHTTTRLIKNDGVEAWLLFTKKLVGSSLGSVSKKNETLIQLYKKRNPDIICLQECAPSLVKALKKEGYLMPESEIREGSAILYKKNTFEEAMITPVKLKLIDLKALQLEGVAVPEKSMKKLVSNEVKIHKVTYKDMIWLVASFHATSQGDNTLLLLEALFNLHRDMEQQEGKKVLLVLGADANTTNQAELIGKKLKEDLNGVDRILEKNGNYIRILHEGSDIGTVQKERSTFQVQLQKAHIRSHGISDFIVVSTNGESDEGTLVLTKIKTYLSSHGPSLQENPSDHRVIGFTFILQKKEEEQSKGEKASS